MEMNKLSEQTTIIMFLLNKAKPSFPYCVLLHGQRACAKDYRQKKRANSTVEVR